MANFILLKALLFFFFVVSRAAAESVPKRLTDYMAEKVKNFCNNDDTVVKPAIHCHLYAESALGFDPQNVRRAEGKRGVVLFARIKSSSDVYLNDLKLLGDAKHPQTTQVFTPTEVAVKILFEELNYAPFFRVLDPRTIAPNPFDMAMRLAALEVGPPVYHLMKKGQPEPLFPGYDILGKIEGPSIAGLVMEMNRDESFATPADEAHALGRRASIMVGVGKVLGVTMSNGLWHCDLVSGNLMIMRADDQEECEALSRDIAGSLRVWNSKQFGACFIIDRKHIRIIDLDLMIKVAAKTRNPCGWALNDLVQFMKFFTYMQPEKLERSVHFPFCFKFFAEFQVCPKHQYLLVEEQNEKRKGFLSAMKGIREKIVEEMKKHKWVQEEHTLAKHE